MYEEEGKQFSLFKIHVLLFGSFKMDIVMLAIALPTRLNGLNKVETMLN